jgi:hypothetical protein
LAFRKSLFLYGRFRDKSAIGPCLGLCETLSVGVGAKQGVTALASKRNATLKTATQVRPRDFKELRKNVGGFMLQVGEKSGPASKRCAREFLCALRLLCDQALDTCKRTGEADYAGDPIATCALEM